MSSCAAHLSFENRRTTLCLVFDVIIKIYSYFRGVDDAILSQIELPNSSTMRPSLLNFSIPKTPPDHNDHVSRTPTPPQLSQSKFDSPPVYNSPANMLYNRSQNILEKQQQSMLNVEPDGSAISELYQEKIQLLVELLE